jgi:hypothetical protein
VGSEELWQYLKPPWGAHWRQDADAPCSLTVKRGMFRQQGIQMMSCQRKFSFRPSSLRIDAIFCLSKASRRLWHRLVDSTRVCSMTPAADKPAPENLNLLAFLKFGEPCEACRTASLSKMAWPVRKPLRSSILASIGLRRVWLKYPTPISVFYIISLSIRVTINWTCSGLRSYTRTLVQMIR